MFIRSPLPYLLALVRPLLKWFLHRFTGLCELQRICYGTRDGARRTCAVERSLRASRNHRIRNVLTHLDALDALHNHTAIVDGQLDADIGAGVVEVLRGKRCDTRIHPGMGPALHGAMRQIWLLRHLRLAVEEQRCQPYDAGCAEHERRLVRLWELLCPAVALEARITKQWQDIGFQGDDPKTDFRGMGMLGFENLYFFAAEMNKAARQVLTHSQHPAYGYTFAIVGINLTSMACQLLHSGAADAHFFNWLAQSTPPPPPPSSTGQRRQSTSTSTLSAQQRRMQPFHEFYCWLVYEFDRFWLECKPSSIMEFSAIAARFEETVRKRLADESVLLRVRVAVEDV